MRPAAAMLLAVGAAASAGQAWGQAVPDARRWTDGLAAIAADGPNLNGASLYRIGNLRGGEDAMRREALAILSLAAEDQQLAARMRTRLGALGPVPATLTGARADEARSLVQGLTDYLAEMEKTARSVQGWSLARSHGETAEASAALAQAKRGIALTQWGSVLHLRAQRLRVTPDDPHYHALAIREILSVIAWEMQVPGDMLPAGVMIPDPAGDIGRHQAACAAIAAHYEGQAAVAVRRKAARIADLANEAIQAAKDSDVVQLPSQMEELAGRMIRIQNMMLSISSAGAAG